MRRIERPAQRVGDGRGVRRYDEAGLSVLDVIPDAGRLRDHNELAHCHRVQVRLLTGAPFSIGLERHGDDGGRTGEFDEFGVLHATDRDVLRRSRMCVW